MLTLVLAAAFTQAVPAEADVNAAIERVMLRAWLYQLLLDRAPENLEAFVGVAGAAKYLIESQGAGGGWGYGHSFVTGGGGKAHAYGYGGGGQNAGAPKAWPRDRDDLFHYYNVFSLERAGTLEDTKKFGDHDWYSEGAAWLLKHQQGDGGWPTEERFKAGDAGGDRARFDRRTWSTCFALLFLKRATMTLTGAKTPTGK